MSPRPTANGRDSPQASAPKAPVERDGVDWADEKPGREIPDEISRNERTPQKLRFHDAMISEMQAPRNYIYNNEFGLMSCIGLTWPVNGK